MQTKDSKLHSFNMFSLFSHNLNENLIVNIPLLYFSLELKLDKSWRVSDFFIPMFHSFVHINPNMEQTEPIRTNHFLVYFSKVFAVSTVHIRITNSFSAQVQSNKLRHFYKILELFWKFFIDVTLNDFVLYFLLQFNTLKCLFYPIKLWMNYLCNITK